MIPDLDRNERFIWVLRIATGLAVILYAVVLFGR